MQVEELSAELGVKPEKLAQRIQQVGLGYLDPDTDLTPQQEAVLRASFPPPTDRKKKLAIIGGSAVALIAVVAFFMSQTTAAEDSRDQQGDLSNWQEETPATVAPSALAEANVPQNVPRDRAKFCAAWTKIDEEERSAPEIDGLQEDFTAYRKWARDRTAWRAAVDEAAATGPPDGIPAHRNYRDMQQRYYNALVNASDSDLRGLADGIKLNDLKNWDRDGDNAVRDLKPHVNPHCNGILG